MVSSKDRSEKTEKIKVRKSSRATKTLDKESSGKTTKRICKTRSAKSTSKTNNEKKLRSNALDVVDIKEKSKLDNFLDAKNAPQGNIKTDLLVALFVIAQKIRLNVDSIIDADIFYSTFANCGYEGDVNLSIEEIKKALDKLVQDEALEYIEKYSTYIRKDTMQSGTYRVFKSTEKAHNLVIRDLSGRLFEIVSSVELQIGDEVECTLDTKTQIAYINNVLSRLTSVIGSVRDEGKTKKLVPLDSDLTSNVYTLDAKSAKKVKDGDIVICSIVEVKHKIQFIVSVDTIVDGIGQYNYVILSSILKYNIPNTWPDGLIRSLNKIKDEVEPSQIVGRRDLRKLPLVTIDGEDARDFDDAVFCQKEDDDTWRLYVAIADVSYYVKIGTLLDKEAINRCNSVYFPNYVIPMLPKQLSNGICSLNPKVDRLCMVCEMIIDKKGIIKNYEFYPAVMNSHARLTYTQAHSMIENKEVENKELEKFIPHLECLYEMYQALRKAREKRGGISIEGEEIHVIFDENMKIERIDPYIRNESHMLIEECMIAANVAAANFVEKHGYSTLYRVHAKPSEQKLETLNENLLRFGLSLNAIEPTPLDYSKLIKKIAKREDRRIIELLLLQSMQKATYSPDNIGHYGLALEKYAHFTSPIRRYPDLQLHRVIKYILQKETKDAKWGKIGARHYSKEELAHLGERCTSREIAADMAESDVDNTLKCEFLKDHIGETLTGVITAFTNFGIFVKLDNYYVDGLIFVGNLTSGVLGQDYYESHKPKKKYFVGSKVSVVLTDINIKEKKIHLIFEQDKKSYIPDANFKNQEEYTPKLTAKNDSLDDVLKKISKNMKREKVEESDLVENSFDTIFDRGLKPNLSILETKLDSYGENISVSPKKVKKSKKKSNSK